MKQSSLSWLQDAIPRFFSTNNFEIETCIPENGEDVILVRVYSSLLSSEFRKQRRELFKEMKNEGYDYLNIIICVYQKRE